MPVLSRRTLRAQIAAASRHHPEADLTELRRQHAAAKLEEFIERTVAAAPPLTPEQRDRLALLLRSGGADPPGGPAAPSSTRWNSVTENRGSGSADPPGGAASHNIRRNTCAENRGGADPPGGAVAPSIRREHERRGSGSATPESLSGAS